MFVCVHTIPAHWRVVIPSISFSSFNCISITFPTFLFAFRLFLDDADDADEKGKSPGIVLNEQHDSCFNTRCRMMRRKCFFVLLLVEFI